MYIGFPLAFDDRGRTAAVTYETHIRDLIEQVLFTAPGERVNRPTFGSGIMQLVFAPSDATLAAAAQLTVHGTLQQWLGDLILVEAVDVVSEDSVLRVSVDYIIRRSGDRAQAQFERSA